jgi:tetratricopeptide (TPR) repeat protein
LTDEVNRRPRFLLTFPRKYIHLLMIATVGLLVYSNTLDVPFIYDGKGQIRDNRMIKDLGNFRLALEGRSFSQAEGYLYVPSRIVGYLSFGLNYHFDSLDVRAYHITNLVIHLFSATLVYFLVLLTFGTPAMRMRTMTHGPPSAGAASHAANLLAFFSALLFVSHPVQTEAVTYIVQRFTSLATMFYMLSAVTYIKGRLLTEEAGDRRYRATGAIFFFCSLIAAVLAMKTKEFSFTLPIVIVIYEFLFFPSPLRKRLFFLAPALLTLTIIPLTLLGTNKPISEILSDVTEKTRLETSIPRADYLLTQMRVITTYIRLLFIPVGQNFDYDYPIYHSLLAPPVLLSFICLSVIFVAAAYLLFKSRQAEDHGEMCDQRKTTGDNGWGRGYRQEATAPGSLSSPADHGPLPITALYRLIAFGILWFFVTLSVTSSVIPIADVIVEHRLYLPSVGAFLAITALGFALAGRLNLSERKRVISVIAVFGIIVMMLSATAYSRNAVWGTAASLWQDVVAKSPNKARPHNNLGEVYYAQNRLDEAMREFQTALKLRPDYAVAHNNYGTVCAARGLLMKAEEQFRTAVTLAPAYADAHYNLAQAYLLMGQTEKAAREFQTALLLNPADAAARKNLASLTGKRNLKSTSSEPVSRSRLQAGEGNGNR